MDQNEIKSIMENKFTIDCPNMKLAPQLSDSLHKIHEGSGFIGQNQDGSFSLKMYTKEELSFEDNLLYHEDSMPGEIIEEKHYYQLFTKDISGREWKSKWILPDIHAGSVNNGNVISAKISEISCSSSISNENDIHHASIYFPGEIEVPFNKLTQEEKIVDGEKRAFSSSFNVAKFDSCDFKFEIKKEIDWLKFDAYSITQEINDTHIMRFVESLQFVLARTLSWSIAELIDGKIKKIKIKSCQRNSEQLRIGSPVYMDGPFSHAWSLFDKYLKHVINYKDKDSWHPISSWVHAVIESGSVSLNTESLVLSVAIEGLLKEEFKHLRSDSSELETQIREVKSIIHKSALNPLFKERLYGSFDAMSQTRAKDLLHILKEKNLINSRFIAEYGKLRNPSTHGDYSNMVNLQEYIDRCACILMLFYHLIFLSIGYKGKYIDYSMRGFPVKEFNISLI
jgi:hypothetical protein